MESLATPRSISVFLGRYHIMSNASKVNNCIMSIFNYKFDVGGHFNVYVNSQFNLRLASCS